LSDPSICKCRDRQPDRSRARGAAGAAPAWRRTTLLTMALTAAGALAVATSLLPLVFYAPRVERPRARLPHECSAREESRRDLVHATGELAGADSSTPASRLRPVSTRPGGGHPAYGSSTYPEGIEPEHYVAPNSFGRSAHAARRRRDPARLAAEASLGLRQTAAEHRLALLTANRRPRRGGAALTCCSWCSRGSMPGHLPSASPCASLESSGERDHERRVAANARKRVPDEGKTCLHRAHWNAHDAASARLDC